MTREEAISIMNVIIHMLEPQYDTDRIEDAVEMAIAALSRSENTNKWIACSERLINEYISKVGCCDECFASVYCTVNRLRESRVPQDYCVNNIKRYFGDKASPTGAEGSEE